MADRWKLAKELAAAKTSDPLAGKDAKEVAAFYRRVADFVEARVGKDKSFAAQFLRHWLDGKGKPLHLPPGKLANNNHVISYLKKEVRPVFLSQKPVFRTSGNKPVLGAATRIRDVEMNKKEIDRDTDGKPIMNYEGPSVGTVGFWEALAIMDKSRSGTLNQIEKDTLDIFTSFHKFAIENKLKFDWTKAAPNSYRVNFIRWECRATDRYDFNYTLGFPVPNPDKGVEHPEAIAPDREFVFLNHAHGQSLVAANLAHDFEIETGWWRVTDAALVKSEVIEVT